MPRTPKGKNSRSKKLDVVAVKTQLAEYYNVDCRLLAYQYRMQPQGILPGKVAFYQGQQAKRTHQRMVRRALIAFLNRGERNNVLTQEHWRGFRDLAFQFDKFRLPARREHLMKRTRGKVYGHDGAYIGRMPLATGAENHAYKVELGAPLPSTTDLAMARINHDHKVETRFRNRLTLAIATAKAEYGQAVDMDLSDMVARSLRLLLAQGQPGNLKLTPSRLPIVGQPKLVKRA